jgi:hypothetical protein
MPTLKTKTQTTDDGARAQGLSVDDWYDHARYTINPHRQDDAREQRKARTCHDDTQGQVNPGQICGQPLNMRTKVGAVGVNQQTSEFTKWIYSIDDRSISRATMRTKQPLAPLVCIALALARSLASSSFVSFPNVSLTSNCVVFASSWVHSPVSQQFQCESLYLDSSALTPTFWFSQQHLLL